MVEDRVQETGEEIEEEATMDLVQRICTVNVSTEVGE